MMNLKEIEAASSALGNQMRAGMALADILKRMSKLQKKYASFWLRASLGVSNGQRFSDFAAEIFPLAIVNAIKAGEESGNMEGVYERIKESIKTEREVLSMVKQLIYPAVIAAMGLSVFIFFMIYVIPNLVKALGTGDKGMVLNLSAWMVEYSKSYWLVTLVGVVLFIGLIINWLKDADNRAMVTNFFLTLPILGEALRNLYFGMWAHYMALMDSSGSITLKDGLILSSSVLPAPLRTGLLLMSEEIIERGVLASCDPDKQKEGDPRKLWPFYVSNAFMISETTGALDKELIQSGPSMIEEGKETLKIFLNIANFVALFISALLITAPILAYYGQLANVLQGALKA